MPKIIVYEHLLVTVIAILFTKSTFRAIALKKPARFYWVIPYRHTKNHKLTKKIQKGIYMIRKYLHIKCINNCTNTSLLTNSKTMSDGISKTSKIKYNVSKNSSNQPNDINISISPEKMEHNNKFLPDNNANGNNI